MNKTNAVTVKKKKKKKNPNFSTTPLEKIDSYRQQFNKYRKACLRKTCVLQSMKRCIYNNRRGCTNGGNAKAAGN